MFNYDFLNATQFFGRKSKISCESDWLQPKLDRQIVPINMDMWRLIGLMAVKV